MEITNLTPAKKNGKEYAAAICIEAGQEESNGPHIITLVADVGTYSLGDILKVTVEAIQDAD